MEYLLDIALLMQVDGKKMETEVSHAIVGKKKRVGSVLHPEQRHETSSEQTVVVDTSFCTPKLILHTSPISEYVGNT